MRQKVCVMRKENMKTLEHIITEEDVEYVKKELSKTFSENAMSGGLIEQYLGCLNASIGLSLSDCFKMFKKLKDEGIGYKYITDIVCNALLEHAREAN
jgi:hypothetical protein